MNYDELSESSRFFGPVYYVLFHVFCLLIMLNMFIAILTDAYASIREEDAQNPNYQAATLSSMVSHAFREMAQNLKRIVTCSQAPPEDAQTLPGAAHGKRRSTVHVVAPGAEAGVQMTKVPPPLPQSIKSSKVADSSILLAAHTQNGQSAQDTDKSQRPFAEINGAQDHTVAVAAPNSLAVAWAEPSTTGVGAPSALVVGGGGGADDDFDDDLEQDDDAWELVEDLLDQQEAMEKRMESMERTMGLMHALLERVARNTAAAAGNDGGMMSARGAPPSGALAGRKPSMAVASSAPGAAAASPAASPSAAASAVKAPASLPPLGARSPAVAQPTPVRSTQLPPMNAGSVPGATGSSQAAPSHDAAAPAADPPPVPSADSSSSSSSSVAAALSAAAPAPALPGVLSVSDDEAAPTPVHEITTPVGNRQASGSQGNVTAIPFVMMSPGRSNWPPRLNPQLLQQQSSSQLTDEEDADLPASQPPPTTHASAAKDR